MSTNTFPEAPSAVAYHASRFTQPASYLNFHPDRFLLNLVQVERTNPIMTPATGERHDEANMSAIDA